MFAAGRAIRYSTVSGSDARQWRRNEGDLMCAHCCGIVARSRGVVGGRGGLTKLRGAVWQLRKMLPLSGDAKLRLIAIPLPTHRRSAAGR
jgi:hypothetical protein